MLFNIFICLIILLFTYTWYKNQFFKKWNLNHLKPLPLFGNMFQITLGRKHIIDITKKTFEKYPIDKYVGLFNFFTPIYLINDPKLAKKIYIKDFDHFVDHMQLVDEDLDPLFAKNLFALRGEKWKEMRNTLSPAFTSAKMRGMFPLILDCTKNLTDYIQKNISNSINKEKDQKYAEFETKELTRYFANDVIATCAFGVNVDSFDDTNNNFFKYAKGFTDVTLASLLKIFMFFISPSLTKVLNIQLSNEEPTSFFKNLVINNMKERETKKITRLDMIHLLMLAKKGTLNLEAKSLNDDNGFATVNEKTDDSKLKKTKWTDEDIVAQALIFIFAGFDTVSTVLSFVLHEIALSQDVQKKLYDEIKSHTDIKNKPIEYGDLSDLKYLDMVVSETLRLWPPAPVLDRVCVKPYNLPPQNESMQTGHKLQIGETVWISAYDIQRDPKHFPNPEKFDPERFSDNNKMNIDPDTYMPFGIGPRACIGSRFALMEIKMFIIYILTHFEVIPTSKTPNPIKLKPHFFNLEPEGDFWIGFKLR